MSTLLTCPTESVSFDLLHSVGPSSFQICLMTATQLSDHCDDDFSSETNDSTLTASLAADLYHVHNVRNSLLQVWVFLEKMY